MKEGVDIELEIILVPKEIKLGTLKNLALVLQINIVKTFKPIILIYKRCNFIYCNLYFISMILRKISL